MWARAVKIYKNISFNQCCSMFKIILNVKVIRCPAVTTIVTGTLPQSPAGTINGAAINPTSVRGSRSFQVGLIYEVQKRGNASRRKKLIKTDLQ